MWEFLTATLSAIPSAASNGYALAAYALAIVAYIVTVWRVARNKNLLANLQKLPPKDRLSALEIETGGVRLAAGISPEQWVRSRIHRYYLIAFLATCAVAIAVAALAAVKGASYVRTLNIIHNEFRQISNSVALSGADLQHIQETIEASLGRDREAARTAFHQLSETARTAYGHAYAQGSDGLISPAELNGPPPPVPIQPASVAIDTHEIEPNDDFLHANKITLDTAIEAAIDHPGDVDVFTFTMPGNRRDFVDVILSNESTTLAPNITIYRDTNSGSESGNRTRGGNVTHSFVGEPGIRYHVRISPIFDFGSYRLTVRPRKAYDRYEPNDDILSASKIAIGETIEAGIMDPGDVDFYSFESGAGGKLIASLENRSTTLPPTITIFDYNKSSHASASNTTRGGDVSVSFDTMPNKRYYAEISSYYSSATDAGAYALTVRGL